jgi:hypothetical protein
VPSVRVKWWRRLAGLPSPLRAAICSMGMSVHSSSWRAWLIRTSRSQVMGVVPVLARKRRMKGGG